LEAGIDIDTGTGKQVSCTVGAAEILHHLL